MKRSDHQHLDSWWPVAGKPEGGETARETALRELQEETGLVPLEVHEFGMEIPHADPACRLETFVAVVEPGSEIRLNYEHSDYQWVDGEGAVAIVPEHSRVYLRHLKESFMDANNPV